ncbi:MraY family glycosyltransferase [Bacteroides thetaiotaomicron]|uniref:Undecaprenyl/decaprenyl-phosphate alpha-N-acetylglucosaminyl 1-phosphate transferase n=1 Tax=Bacteroides thetaiotaomicron TaxID=818 RepID=A0AAW4ZI86_BACT4|nr:MraY family glycosyltransferase [Bacteroides thetaiotaomicron]MCE9240471.1 undecaprenyl/decaprenyl-phosphate alpha-N-acetylglucosaminyl 1-phosphate transferase [Bacteroides thetaiotaomicron]MCE9269683.1 undecaprenyl/decaprenyl-phosphate alpha-N-acetylglucosaminyl 1-phosphate transferase [Bacteroides thetaiotaomicron]MCE9279253.1 undecaprenyl/decaprenyl-phosphate alpha-N-acetylglucosaminyl 1-phosphate transferase [Bacteroides thetaiotaomicron]MCE9293489.1 undecaprenyl/decaprenyl-phosphate alp
MNIVFIILAFVISAYIARLIIPRILLISFRKKLFDIPDARKLHKRAIPRLGGVSFFPTILLSCCAVLALRSLTGYSVSALQATYILPEFLALVCGMVLLYLTGIADDLVGVRYRQKFVVQIICASLFPLVGLWINDFYGLFGCGALSVWFGFPFTVLTVVFITNAINLIDGIDGLASGLSSVALMVFGFLFIEKGLWIYSMLAFSTLGVLIPFFYYNVFGSAEHARKIFMGDTGSLTLGYILSFCAIKYSQNTDLIPTIQGAIVIAFSTLIIPSFDVIRVVMVRICNKRNPFEPDKNHIHHKFLAMGFNARQTMILILLISCIFSGINILLVSYMNNTLILLGDIVVWLGLNLWWSRVRDTKCRK